MWKRVLVVAGVVVLLVGAGGIYLATSAPARDWVASLAPKPKPAAVRLEEVRQGDLTRTVNAPGAIEPRTKVQISAQVPARIVALPFRENDAVKAGDVVVRLDSRDLAAAVESAQASVREGEARLVGAEAALAQAEQDLRRARELFGTRDVSQSRLDEAESAQRRAQSTLEATRQSIEVARAQVVRAQRDLENTVIAAPFDGTIVKLNAEVGELVLVGTLNNPASVIMEIADLTVMEMSARVDEANIAPVKAGQQAEVFINAYPGRNFAATVERVGLKRELDRDNTGHFEVILLVQKPDDIVLGSGLTASVDIQVQTLRDVLKVPSQAVVDRRMDELPAAVAAGATTDRTKAFTRLVFREVDGRAVATPVGIGASDLTHTVITSGLEPGQRIIVGPFKSLLKLAHEDAVVDETTVPKEKGRGSTAARSN